MDKKKKVLIAISLLMLLVLNVCILLHREPVKGDYELHLTVNADEEYNLQVYYSDTKTFSEEMSIIKAYETSGKSQELIFDIPSYCTRVRLDFGQIAAKHEITEVYMSCGDKKEEFSAFRMPERIETNQITQLELKNSIITCVTNGDDPYMVLEVPNESLYSVLEKQAMRNTWILNLLMLLLVDGGAVFAIIFRKKVLVLPLELWQNRGLIMNLSKNDFKTKYAGSYLGIVWAFVQPIVTILVYWFVFSVGLKAGMVDEYPFVLYLVSGIVPWFFFQDALNSGTNALIEYNYLVKKVVFKISILPIVKIISALFVHLFFVAFSLILCWCYGYAPKLQTIQILYYSICTFMLVLGLVYATSAIVIFFRDLSQIISIFLQVGVWMTPIMWDLNMLANHPLFMKAFKLNPMYYIVSGYRDAMLGDVWFWEHWGWTLYFWVFVVIVFGLGTVIFKRLKPHFADVL